MSNLLRNALKELLGMPEVYTSERASALINETLAKYDDDLPLSDLVPAESTIPKIVRDAVKDPTVSFVLLKGAEVRSYTNSLEVSLGWDKIKGVDDSFEVKISRGRTGVIRLPVSTFVGLLS